MMPEPVKPFSQFTARAARDARRRGQARRARPDEQRAPGGRPARRAGRLRREGHRRRRAAPEQLYAALGTGPAEQAENTGSAELLDLILDETAKDALKSAMKAALRLGHNYIGTEHFLLGLLAEGGPVAEASPASA